MNNIEFVRKTPHGNIVVIPTGSDDDYPGIVIEFDGEVVARVEYNEYDKGLAVMSWYKGNEDYSSKLVSSVDKDSILYKIKSDESLSKLENIYHAIKTIEESDGIKINLTDTQLLTLIGKAKSYDYSTYNEYVADLVREEINKEHSLSELSKDKNTLSVLNAMKSIEELDGVKVLLSPNEILELSNKVKKYNVSNYNNYVVDLVRKEIYDGKKW